MEQVKDALMEKLHEAVGYDRVYARVSSTGTILPKAYANWREKFDNFEVRSDDVWVISPPKSGTTWTQELVWCIMFDMNSEEAKVTLSKKFPFFEYESILAPNRDVSMLPEDDPRRPGKSWENIMKLKSPRTIKTHLPYPLLPKNISAAKPKIVFVFRDPRDMCVSYYYHFIKHSHYKGSFDDFAQLFVNDLLMHLPYWFQVLGFWKLRHNKNILLLRYEDMKEDLASEARRVAAFLGKSLTEREIAALVEHCSFDVMKDNPAANNESLTTGSDADKAKGLKFMRKGVVGDWKNHLTPDQEKSFKEWTKKNVVGTDFPYYQD